MVLLWSMEEWDNFEKLRPRQIAEICFTDESLNCAVMSPVEYMDTSRARMVHLIVWRDMWLIETVLIVFLDTRTLNAVSAIQSFGYNN